MLDEQVLHGAAPHSTRAGPLCSKTGGRGDKPTLVHQAGTGQSRGSGRRQWWTGGCRAGSYRAPSTTSTHSPGCAGAGTAAWGSQGCRAMQGTAGRHTHTMYSGEGREGEKGASLVQEIPHHHHHHHHHHERWAQHQWDLVGREMPAVSRTMPQPAPSTPARLLVLRGLALLSQQAMEMVLVRQFNQKLGETSRVYHSNFFFFPSQNEGRNSAVRKFCFCLFLRHLSRAMPLQRHTGPPVLANTTQHFANNETKQEHRTKTVHTFFLEEIRGINSSAKVFATPSASVH